MWKNVEVSKASVLYIYIYIYRLFSDKITRQSRFIILIVIKILPTKNYQII